MRKLLLSSNKLRLQPVLKSILLFCIVLLLQSCLKDDFSKITTGAWGPEFALPVINTKLILKDFLKDDLNGFVKEDKTTHYLSAVYRGTPVSKNSNDVMQVSNQTASIPVKAPASFSSFSGIPIQRDTTVSDTASNNAKVSNANNIAIETLKIKSGLLKISVVSDFKFSGEITITFPTFKNSSQQIISMKVNFSNDPLKSTKTDSLKFATVDMSLGGTTSNTMPVKYKIDAYLKQGQVLDPSQKITVNLEFKDIIFSYIDGYFGSLPLDVKESFPIGLFHYLQGGSLNLQNPMADFIIKNSYGLPVEMLFTTLQVRNMANAAYPFAAPQITGGNPIIFPYPGITEVGQTKTDTLKINPSTSNISSVIAQSPVKFEYVGKVTTNAKGKQPNEKNFITDSSKAVVDVNINIPLWGTATGFTAQDTFPFVIGNIENLESLTMKINTENAFPLDVDLQLYFADSLGVKLDSLVMNNERFLKSGVINGAGEIIAPTITTITAEIDKTRLPRIAKTKKILLKGVLNTTIAQSGPQFPIHVSSDNYLGVKLGVRTKLKLLK
jgi:hypothetical protein